MRPSIILASVTAVTIGFGLEVGAVWAFVGGVTANLLTTDPLGTMPLGLLAVAALLAAAARLRLPTLALAALGGALGSVLLTGLTALWMWIGIDPSSLPANGVLAIMVPSALVNGALAVVFWLGLRAILGRMGREPALA